MARFLARTLINRNPEVLAPKISPRVLTHHRRHRSDHSSKGQLIEIELDSSASSSDGEIEVLGIQKLEEVIQSIVVRRSAPDWLPFIPGSSYWVPPPRLRQSLNGRVELAGSTFKFNSSIPMDAVISINSDRGWPSQAYFIEGGGPAHQMPMEVEELGNPENEGEEG